MFTVRIEHEFSQLPSQTTSAVILESLNSLPQYTCINARCPDTVIIKQFLA
jgi:hypothetical protein